jgi:cob(I)alamin adenosyltransferase
MFSGRGDDGYTDTLAGMRVPKDHPMIDLIGEIDELSAWIGLVLSEEQDSKILELLPLVQDALTTMMSALSSYHPEKPVSNSIPFPNILELEKWIDDCEPEIHMPTSFVRAGSTRLGALYNLVRTVARRVERKAVENLPADFPFSDEMISYLNRLSSLFFLLWMRADQR